MFLHLFAIQTRYLLMSQVIFQKETGCSFWMLEFDLTLNFCNIEKELCSDSNMKFAKISRPWSLIHFFAWVSKFTLILSIYFGHLYIHWALIKFRVEWLHSKKKKILSVEGKIRSKTILRRKYKNHIEWYPTFHGV